MATKTLEQQPRDSFILPRDAYDLRCVNAEMKTTQKTGSPMLVLEFEIVAPLEKNIPGRGQTEVVGIKTNEYVVFYEQEIEQLKQLQDAGTITDEELERLTKAQKATRFTESKMAGLHKGMGLPMEIDETNIDSSAYIGKTLCALLKAEKVETRGADGKLILDEDGKPLVVYLPKIDRYLGPARWSEVHPQF